MFVSISPVNLAVPLASNSERSVSASSIRLDTSNPESVAVPDQNIEHRRE